MNTENDAALVSVSAEQPVVLCGLDSPSEADDVLRECAERIPGDPAAAIEPRHSGEAKAALR